MRLRLIAIVLERCSSNQRLRLKLGGGAGRFSLPGECIQSTNSNQLMLVFNQLSIRCTADECFPSQTAELGRKDVATNDRFVSKLN